MKLLNKATIAALLIAGTMTAGTASAMLTSSTAPLTGIVGVTASDISVRVDEGVATLFGTVESISDKAAAQRHVANLEGVDQVINLILTSR